MVTGWVSFFSLANSTLLMTWYYQLFVVHYGTYTQFVNNDCTYAPHLNRNTLLIDRVLLASDIG
jgi:hypothetical protein